jgi:hypothetical protein
LIFELLLRSNKLEHNQQNILNKQIIIIVYYLKI